MKRIILTANLVLIAVISASAARLHFSVDRIMAYPEGSLLQVSILADTLSTEIGGFRLVLSEAGPDYTFTNAAPGSLVSSCNWDYFSWRRIVLAEPVKRPGSDAARATTALLEITGYASPGEAAASCASSGSSVELARIQVLVPFEHPILECVNEPISFFWRDCSDNVLVTRSGDTALTASGVYEYSPYSQSLMPYPFPGFGAPDIACDSVNEAAAVPTVAVTSGFLDFLCTDCAASPLGSGCMSASGDVNLNRISCEAADIVCFGRYFQYGLGVFAINQAGQIAATDVDHDGNALQLTDLYRMMMISRLDHFGQSPSPGWVARLNEERDAARVSYQLESECPVGACWVRVVSSEGSGIAAPDGTPLPAIGQIGDTTTLLWISQASRQILPAGTHVLFEAPRGIRVVDFSVVDTDGRTMQTLLKTTMPEQYTLAQNYPNPFNPTTEIGFDLPVASVVRLEIFNVLGEQVAVLANAELTAGHHTISWDGTNAAHTPVGSGVYFYRLQAGGFSQTKKMLLIK